MDITATAPTLFLAHPFIDMTLLMKLYMKYIIYRTADVKSNKLCMIVVMNAIIATAYGSLKNSGLQRGLNP